MLMDKPSDYYQIMTKSKVMPMILGDIILETDHHLDILDRSYYANRMNENKSPQARRAPAWIILLFVLGIPTAVTLIGISIEAMLQRSLSSLCSASFPWHW